MNSSSLRIGIVMMAIGATTAGCATSTYNPGTEHQETLIFGTEREIAIGESVSKQVDKQFTVIKDPKLLEQLDRVSNRLVPVADRKDLSYRFTIVEMPEDDQPNAFALPGGPVYVTQSLMALVKSDDELASVLGHEMGHVVAKHAMKHLQASIGMQALQIAAVATKTDSQTIQGMDLAITSLFLEYSQEDELEADRLAVKYTYLAGFDMNGIIETFKVLEQDSKGPNVPVILRSHPFLSDRIAAVAKEIAVVKEKYGDKR